MDCSAISKTPEPASNPGILSAEDIGRLSEFTSGLKRRIRSLLGLTPGQRVLDVGCGIGLDTTAIAADIGPTGLVTGIDRDASMIRHAKARAEAMGQSTRVWHLVADGVRIPYATGVFDSCYSERLLQHTSESAAVVREMARVTKPGGAMVIADTDWGTLSIDAPEAAVERALVRFVGKTLYNAYAGRQLRRLLKAEGLVGVGVEVWPIIWTNYAEFRSTSLYLLGMDQRAVRAREVSAAELERFHEALNEADHREAFFASSAMFVAWGRKSASSPEQGIP